MKRNSLLLPASLILLAASISFSGISGADAVNVSTASRAVQMTRLRVSSTEVGAATNTSDPDGTCNGLAKRIVLYTVPAGGQIVSIVTKARTAFSGSGISQVGIRAIRAEQVGVQISTGNIAMPHPDLTDTVYIENRATNSGEIAFYDEDQTWDVVAYICGQDESSVITDISGLAAGSVDFYTLVSR